jgi:mannobiose 2-epimerase
MAQAFILLGLSEYNILFANPIVEAEIKKHQQFIFNTISDRKSGGYLDGFDVNWKQEKTFTKSLATHMHLLEALVKQYECTKDKSLVAPIRELMEILINKFIDRTNRICLHRFTPEWDALPNFNWAGHNAEAGWLLCQAARALGDKELQNVTCEIVRSLCESVIEKAFDKNYGGIFNEIGVTGEPVSMIKEWWPQAEAAIALFYAYECSRDKNYLSYAIRLIEYIENTFSDSLNGEWFSSVTREGMPIGSEPKVHFWKSMYHNVRYCIEVSNLLKRVIR